MNALPHPDRIPARCAVRGVRDRSRDGQYSSGLVAITNPWFIAAGPDGNMWFTGNNSPGRVARITLPPLVKDAAADQVEAGSARLKGRVRPNSQATN
jgi:hypothetical protein